MGSDFALYHVMIVICNICTNVNPSYTEDMMCGVNWWNMSGFKNNQQRLYDLKRFILLEKQIV
jgi:hypothetical protein